MILAPDGTLVWFHPVRPGDMAADFQVQRYRGRPVITWWQGYSGAGLGYGEDVIDDSSYRRLAIVHGTNGLSADLHEFQLTSRGTALITAYYPVYWDASSVGGARRQIVLDSVVQEIDVKTGLPLFQWDSLDHVPLRDSYEPVPKSAGQPFDYFHVNSVEQDGEDLIISARNTSPPTRWAPPGGCCGRSAASARASRSRPEPASRSSTTSARPPATGRSRCSTTARGRRSSTISRAG